MYLQKYREEKRRLERELRALQAQEHVLAEMMNTIYSYQVILDLETGQYKIHLGKRLETHGEDIFHVTGDYATDYERKRQLICPEFREEYDDLASLKALRRVGDQLDYVRTLEYACQVGDIREWHELTVIISKDVDDRSVANILSREITEHRIQEEMKAELAVAKLANEAKSSFLSNMSHDIRTPINGIIGMIEIAKRYSYDRDRVGDCIHKMETSAQYLKTLVNDILDLNKYESGKVELLAESFDILQMLEETRDMLMVQSQNAAVALKVSLEPIPHSSVKGSMLHVRQILMNLIGNAIKYNRNGGQIWVRVDELDMQDSIARYQFEVKDNGIGMTEEFQSHMFDSFAQESAGARSEQKGTGLGLAIVKMLVELMGGEIQVDSTKNVGTTFRVILPFEVDDRKATEIDVTKEEDEKREGLFNTRVLLVEDNSLNMEIARVLLEDEGCIVDTAENGEVGVKLFEASEIDSYDIVLMDIRMPVMDGLEATRVIRALNREDATRVPIFALTANAFMEDMEECFAAGMNEHIIKPLDIGVLMDKIRSYTQKS